MSYIKENTNYSIFFELAKTAALGATGTICSRAAFSCYEGSQIRQFDLALDAVAGSTTALMMKLSKSVLGDTSKRPLIRTLAMIPTIYIYTLGDSGRAPIIRNASNVFVGALINNWS